MPPSRYLLVSLALHTALGFALVANVHFAPSRPRSAPPLAKPILQATLIPRSQVEQELRRITQEERKKRQAKEEQRRQEQLQKTRQQAEAEKKRQEEAQRQQAEAEKKRQEEARHQQAEAEKKRQEEARRQQAEAEKKRQEEAQRQQTEAEKKRQEEAQRLAVQRQRDQTEIDRYKGLIINRIANKFNRAGLSEELTCTLLIRVTPSGEIVRADVVESSGSAVFDRRAVAAVFAAAPLPLPDEGRIFNEMRTMRTIFRPWDE